MMSGWTMDWNVMADAMLATGIKGALLLSGVAGLALLMREGSAARRHLVWTMGMVGLLALPFIQLGAPNWNVEVSWLKADHGSGEAEEVAPEGTVRNAVGVASSMEAAGVAGEGRDVPTAAADRVLPGIHHEPRTPVTAPRGKGDALAVVPPADTRITPARRAEATMDWPLLFLAIWGFGALLMGASVVANHLSVRRLERASRPFPIKRVTQELSRLAPLMEVDRPVRLLEGGEGQMPMTWGLVWPAILLPRGAERWPAERLRAVLLHELAHIQRADCLTQLVAELARALHWVNPLAWVAVWRLRVEREFASDDQVLEAGAEASVYAEELLALARGFRAAREGSRAAVAMARASTLESRLRAVLAEGRRRTLSRRGAAMTTGLAVVLTTAVAGLSAVPAASEAAEERSPAPYSLDPSTEPAGAEAPSDGARYSPAETAVTTAVEPPSEVMRHPLDVPAGTLTSPGPLPTAQTMSCGTHDVEWDRSSHMQSGDETRIEWSRRGCEVRVYIGSAVEFNATFNDIAHVDRGERFAIEEDDGSTERWLRITPGAGGAPEYEYRVNRDERPFDAEARLWFQELLTEVFRHSGLMAAERVTAFLARGGVDTIRQEMGRLRSDHAYARYAAELIRQADLSVGQLEDLLDEAAGRIDSDHFLVEVLSAVASATGLNDRLLDPFISASRALVSDHYRAQILELALDRGDLSNAQLRALLASASEIESDHYQAEILTGVSDRYAIQVDLQDAYLAAVSGMESDHYITEVLLGLLMRSELSPGEKATVLRAAGRIKSDHYLTEVLEHLAGRGLETGPLREAYLELARGIESDHYAQRALQAILEHEARLNERELSGLIEAIGAIESEHHSSALLAATANRHRLDGVTRDAFVRAMEGIESRHYRGPVAEAFLRNGG